MRSIRFLLPILFVGFLFFSKQAFSQTIDSLHADGIVLCKLKDSSSGLLDTAGVQNLPLKLIYQKFGVTKVDQPAKGISSRLDRVYRFYMRPSAADSIINALEALPEMEYAEHMPIFWQSDVPNDFNPVDQYFLSLINAPLAWEETQGSPDVTVAIIDNGVRTAHEDLAANIWVNPNEIPNNGFDDDLNGYVDDINGYDVSDDDNNPNPPFGISDTTPWIHGTHCAGISSAVTDNERGVASIGRNLKIIGVKATRNSDNPRMIRNGFDGVIYAISAGADIISMSFGTSENSSTIQLIMEEANLHGIVVVAAAGNANTDQPQYPAAYPGVISVAATDHADRKADFSNYGSWVAISAPGVGIRSTFPGTTSSYGALSGTSMSTPMVAGLAGLILSKFPNLTPDQVLQRIQESADNIDVKNPSYAGKLGAGRINAAQALSGLSVKKDKNLSHLEVYPNPVPQGGKLWVQNTDGLNSIISITDLQGRALISLKTYGKEKTAVSLAGLGTGMYILRCSGAGQPESVKRIVVY